MSAAPAPAQNMTHRDPASTATGSAASETTATIVITAWADSRSKMTARTAGPPGSSTRICERACRQARDTSPSTPPGSTWFKKMDR